MNQPFDLCVVTGIFPPDTGGPAKFADAYLKWGLRTEKKMKVISLTDSNDCIIPTSNSEVKLISRKRSFLSRFLISVFEIRSMLIKDVPVLVNGMFVETLVAYFLSGNRGRYTCKLPGDIVWERARNSGFTNTGIEDFQNIKLPFRYMLFRKLFSLSLAKANKVIVPSKYLSHLCEIWGLEENQIALVYNSVDLDFFSIKEEVEKDYDVVTVCRLLSLKRVDEIVRACAELNLSLAIVGDGPEKNFLETLARDLGSRVTFFGDLDQKAVSEVLRLSRFFVLNSIHEATSYALIEARSIGCFSIARENTGTLEIIQDGVDGLICGPNFRTLVESLRIALTNSSFVSDAIVKARIDTNLRFNQNRNFEQIYSITVSGE